MKSRSSESLLPTMRTVLILFLLWRGSLFAFDFVGIHLIAERRPNLNKDWQAFPNHYYLDGWCRWDGGWYNRIIQKGYYFEGRQSDVAFFPLYPYLSRYVGKVTGNHFVAGLIISNVATLLGLFYLYRIGRIYFSDEATRRAAVLFLLFPGSFFLSAFYSEGLFFFTVAFSMFYFLKRHYLWAGFGGLLAAMTRSPGLLLFAVYGMVLAHDRLKGREPLRWSMLGIFLIPCGLGIFMLMLAQQVGDPLALFWIQKGWGPVYLFDVDFSFPLDEWNMIVFFNSLVSVGFLAVAVLMALRGYHPALWLFALAALILPLWGGRTYSMLRFCAVTFPVFFYLSEIAENRAVERFLVYASAFFLALFNLRYMGWYWAG